MLLFLTLVFLVADVTSSEHVIKRSDDVNPQDAVVTRLTQEVAELQARLQALEQASARQVAFVAELGDVMTLPSKAPIHFKLLHQVGGGYDSLTGIFTAPVSGWYSFQYQLYPQAIASSFNFDLVQNGGLVARTGCGTQGVACSAGTTLPVKAGDRLWLQTFLETSYWQGQHSFFSASLVVPQH